MPWSNDHKIRTRQHILDAAAVLFARRGFEVSIDEVMRHADLTRGAFYAHFSSKSALYAEALQHAARANVARLKAASHRERVFGYLNDAHREGETINCPLACLVSDVAQQDAQVRDTYTHLFAGFVRHFQNDDDAPTDHKRALQQAVILVGGMAIARTLTSDKLAQDLLAACRELASDLIPSKA